MKKIIKHISILSVVLACFSSCELTESIDEIEVQFQLGAENAINNESTANLALAGAYSSFKEAPTFGLVIADVLSGSSTNRLGGGGFWEDEFDGWITNQPVDVGPSDLFNNLTFGSYAQIYRAVNDANWIIEKVGQLDDAVFITSGRRMEVLGEAHGLRALAHFLLLRNWGQWYDGASSLGIALRLEPIRDGQALPRNTVAETYAQIHSDLDFAIANAPDIVDHVVMNKIGARAIKAKTYLYQGDYGMAASTAKTLIDESGGTFGLAPTFAEIFDNSTPDLFQNPEILFGLRGTLEEPLPNLGWNFAFYVNSSFVDEVNAGTMVVGPQTISYDSDRVTSTTLNFFGNINTLKLAGFGDTPNNLVYFARMAEIYLIYAEAEARNTGSVTTDALTALNAIRERAGATTTGGDGFETYPASITLEQFLEAVRIEKKVELAHELGEEWFDLVRYDFADGFGSGFQVSDFKATATDPNKFILPIPSFSIQAGGNVVTQNPSYE